MSKTTLTRLFAVIGFAAVCGGSLHAGLRVPYTSDADTLHLWSFDGPAPDALTPDKGYGGSTMTNYSQTVVPGSVARLEASGLAAIGNALHIVATNLSAGNCYALANGARSDISTVVNPVTGAFTFEALVKPEGNPFVANGNWEIIAADASTAPRGWQFRIQTGPAPSLNFNAFPGNNATVNNLVVPLPTSGANAIVAGQWYHVAAVFNGFSPTNSDTAGVFRLYWTLLDPNRTAADVLLETAVGAGFGLPATGEVPIAVGGSARNFPGTLANSEGFKGFIDEVRMSIVARGSNEMAFTSGGAANPPSFLQQPPATTTIGFGKPLTVAALVSGSQPLTLQWQQNGPGGFTNVAGQTDNSLQFAAARFSNGGTFRLVVGNASGSVTSQVATVNVLASFSELFHTGRDVDGALPMGGPGVFDRHYRLVDSADPDHLGGDTVIWDMTIGPIAANGGGYENINGVSQWVGPLANTYTSPNGTYVYRTTFLIDGGDPATASISGFWGVNSAGQDILVNGVSTGLRNTVAQKPLAPFTITNGFVAGLNTLDFVLTNSGGGSAFRAELTGLATPLPAGIPTITQNPRSQNVRDGSKAVFTAVASGRQPLAYQWRLGGSAIPGATNRVLQLDASLGNLTAGSYSVLVSNDSGSVPSQAATLTLAPTNHAPVLPAFSVTTTVDTAVNLSLSKLVNAAVDADGDPVLFGYADNVSTNNGSVFLDGAFLVYTPPTGYVGADRFNVTLTDNFEYATFPVSVSVRAPGSPGFSVVSAGGSGLVVSGTNGTVGASYRIFATTNVAAPFASWLPVATNTFGANGAFSFTTPVDAAKPQQFFRLQTP